MAVISLRTMAHLDPHDVIDFPEYTVDHPLRIMLSACLAGDKCGVDGTSYGDSPHIMKLMNLSNVKTVRFCPEHFSFGTPRNMPDIVGGDGYDVLDGKARVLTDKGEDWTAGFIKAAHEMLRRAKAERVDIAILQNMSAACGTQVISDGCRLIENRSYRKGPGVCTALLMRNGFRVINTADSRTIELLLAKLDSSHKVDSTLINYDERDWYRDYFGR